MPTFARRILRPVALVTSLVLAAGTTFAQDSAPRQFVVIEHKGLASMVGDPRDAGLKRAMEMLPARLNELREEVPGIPPEVATLMDMLPRMLARPARIAIAYTPDSEPTGGLFNYGIALSVDAADEAEATKNHERIKGLLRSAQAPSSASTRFDGFTEIEMPGSPGKLAYGVRKSPTGWRNEVVFGTVKDLDKTMASPAPALKAGTPILSAMIDFSALTPAERLVLQMAPKDNPQVREFATQFRKMGLLGDDAMKFHVEINATDSELYSLARGLNAGKFKDALHMASEPLSEAHLRAIPADATVAMIASGDLGGMREAIDKMTTQSPEIADVLEQFKQHTGVDLRTDVIDSVGGGFAAYMSDSTGGGGLGSGVFLVGLRDRERFLKAHGKLLAKARQLMEENFSEMPGPYVKLDSWKDGSVEMNALRMRGLPVPLELCYAVTGRWLVLGLTPQAVTAAARQAEGKGDTGILSIPRVAEVIKGHEGKLVALNYSNTARMTREGYTVLALMGNAIANGVRSPIDPAREPGMVVPPPHDLLKNAKSAVSYSYWDGETFVMESRSDRSMVVNIGAVTGTMVQFAPIIMGGVGAAMGAANRGGMGPFGMLPGEMGDLNPGARIFAAMNPWWANPMGPAQAMLVLDGVRRLPLAEHINPFLFAPVMAP